MNSNLAYYKVLQSRRRSEVLESKRSPYHCPDCFYIFDTSKSYSNHFEYCACGNVDAIRSIRHLYNPSLHSVPLDRCAVLNNVYTVYQVEYVVFTIVFTIISKSNLNRMKSKQ